MLDIAGATTFVTESLAGLGDPTTAASMAAYMKSDMPFFGVTKPARVPVMRELRRRWVPETGAEYSGLVRALWELPHREEKYLAIGAARAHDRFVTASRLPLYRGMIVTGAWWDFVDEIAIRLVGRVLDREPDTVTETIRQWIDAPDPWVRRSAIICQVARKERTDEALLFEACARRAHETGFFIRKAIGWALRSYAYQDPDAVRRFVDEHQSDLSGLSRREATKHL